MKKSKAVQLKDTLEIDELVSLVEPEELIARIDAQQPGEVHHRTVDYSEGGWRLDLYLAHHFPVYSRTLIRAAIMAGGVLIDADETTQSRGKPSFRLKPGQTIRFTLPEIPREAPRPEPIPLEILYEDDDLVVVSKPADMVVHPSRGHWSGTLVAGLAYHFAGKLSTIRGPMRPGIVHRLDRDTSGAILVAKNDVVHGKLAGLFEQRKIHKEYFAIVQGKPHLDRDMIDAPIGFHPKVKEKMCIAAANDPDAKSAQTFYEVIKRYEKLAAVRCLPKTGRTHQIRVHLARTGYPILCDRLYGGRKTMTREELRGERPMTLDETSLPEARPNGTVLLKRQALHAVKLAFVHPTTGKELEITAPLPADIQAVLDCLDGKT